jgi:uncharacterized protein (TIGR02284 family)
VYAALFFLLIKTKKPAMEQNTNKEAISVLNDLLRINSDRIEGYQKAADELKEVTDTDLKSLFFSMAEESRRYKSTLTEAVTRLGGDPESSTSTAGDIYRVWMDVKAAFSGDDALAALQSCEFGEDNALKAYRTSLQKDITWPIGTREILESQYSSLKASHDKIKRLRDEYSSLASNAK